MVIQVILKLDPNQIQLAKETSRKALELIINDFNTLLQQKQEFPQTVTYVELQIKSETSGSYPVKYCIDFEFIRSFFQSGFLIEKYRNIQSILEELGFFNRQQLLNPNLTFFGSIVTNYFSIKTEFSEEEDLAQIIPIEYEDNLFEECWQKILPWISDIPIQLRVIYFISNVQFKG